MNTLPIGLLIEGLVSVLLLITIGFCVALHRRLGLLRADEHILRATIGELGSATKRAESAIAGLRAMADRTEETLGQRARGAERLVRDLERQITAGEKVLNRIVAISRAASPSPPRPAATPARGAVARRTEEAA